MKSIIHYSLLVFTFAILAIGCINSGSEAKKTGLAPNVTDGPFTTIILTETHEVDLYRQRGLVSIVDLSNDTKQDCTATFVENNGILTASLLDGRTLTANLKAGTFEIASK